MSDVISALTQKPHHIDPAFLTESEVSALVADLRECQSRGGFHRAGVGKATELTVADDIRTDQVCWIEPRTLTEPQRILWRRLSDLKDAINREFFFGLWDFEGHYAIYPAGGFYRRHLDRFRADDARALTIIVYLNQNWQPGDGGELVLYLPDGEVRIEPRAGAAAVFLSDQIEHEVLPSRVERLSFAGWFRRRRVAGA